MRTRSILFMTFLLGWVATSWAADQVKGNGKLTTKQITVSDYNEIKIDEVIDFYYEQSNDSASVEVTIDQNLHQYIDIDVEDRVLTIGFTGAKVDHFTKFIVRSNSRWLSSAKLTGSGNLTINGPLTGDETTIKTDGSSVVTLKGTVKLGKLNLDANGSANMVISYLEADEVDCDLDGSGTITIESGKAKEASYSSAGSTTLQAFNFEVDDVTCKMTGSSLAEVYATTSLNAQIIGKGTIQYKGSPEVKSRVIGKGSVEQVIE